MTIGIYVKHHIEHVHILMRSKFLTFYLGHAISHATTHHAKKL